MLDLIKIGQLIESLRKQHNMTQDDLASKLFVSRQAISKWERGKGMPSIELLIELTNLFNVTIDTLLDGADLSKTDYKKQFNQLPRQAVFANFIQSETLENDVKKYFYLFNDRERTQFLDFLIKQKIHLPYKTVWPHLSEDERVYLFGYILSNEKDQIVELYPHLNQTEEQMLYKKHPNKKPYYMKRKERIL